MTTKYIRIIALALATTFTFSTIALAEEDKTATTETTEATTEDDSPKGSLSLGLDLTSAYLWRGARVSGVSLQPAIGFEIAGFSIGAWGSTDFNFNPDGYQELDFTIGYSIFGASIALTDYCWNNGAGDFDYFGEYEDNHYLELGLGYDFGEYFENVPITLNAAIMLYGANVDSTGEQANSTYLEIAYSYPVQDIVDLNVALGAAIEGGGANFYSAYDGFQLVNVNVGASHEFNIKDMCAVSVSADIVWNPAMDGIFFGAGVGFSM